MSWRGFTLIEVVVAMSIVVLMLGVGIPAFRGYGNRSSLEQAASEVQAAIYEAKNYALSPQIEKPTEIDRYGIKFSKNNFIIFEDDGGEGITVDERQLNPLISFTNFPASGIYFSIPKKKVKAPLLF